MTDTSTYSVLSLMKNEGPFILEWVAYYKLLGFDNIVILPMTAKIRLLKYYSIWKKWDWYDITEL